jgi:hypothetical protein
MFTTFTDALSMHSLFSSYFMQPDIGVSAVTGNGLPDKILSICLAQEDQEMYP